MNPLIQNSNVNILCPVCNRETTYTFKSDHGEFGSVIVQKHHTYEGKNFSRIIYQLMQCTICGRGGLAEIHANNTVRNGKLGLFYPVAFKSVQIPDGIPEGILNEFKEAEFSAASNCWRGASVLFRSVIEKTLKENGYIRTRLIDNIDDAADDGVITDSRRKKAHDDIRVLGNNVLHDEWREVTRGEVEQSHHYTQRILEDFYDDRQTVEKVLKQKGRNIKSFIIDESKIIDDTRKKITIIIDDVKYQFLKSSIILSEIENQIEITVTEKVLEESKT